MAIEKKAFRKYNLEKKQDAITIWLNPEERKRLDELKYILQQEKDSTAYKQLAEIAANLIGDKKTKTILSLVLNNYRKNKRLSIVTFD